MQDNIEKAREMLKAKKLLFKENAKVFTIRNFAEFSQEEWKIIHASGKRIEVRK